MLNSKIITKESRTAEVKSLPIAIGIAGKTFTLSLKKQWNKLFLLLSLMLYVSVSKANNIRITNVSLVVTGSVKQVQFDIAWDNSWRSSITNNFDAAWVFFKINNGGTWQHLNRTGANDVIPSGFTKIVPDDVKGIFIVRSNFGSGNVALTGVRVGVNPPAIAGNFDIKAFGIEMVFVPTAAFNVGDGNPPPAFTSTTINTSNASVAGGFPIGQTPPNAAWPNGFNSFMCMKYEISQEQYVEFLNSLTRAQQINRVETDITGTAITNRYVMSASTVVFNRNGIRCDSTIPAAPNPVTFYCDLNAGGGANNSDDGQGIACNFLSWTDLAAYLDWSALRPMTELEFEKICRGPLAPVAGEFAWGSQLITGATGVSNSGAIYEAALNAGANAVFGTTFPGPLRVGSFANATTGRLQSGAAYYGVMEMSGNVFERLVSLTSAGSTFTGLNGDGSISVAGFADVANWPVPNGIGTSAPGSGFRGGSWNNSFSFLQVSDRMIVTNSFNGRFRTLGGRGVRGF